MLNATIFISLFKWLPISLIYGSILITRNWQLSLSDCFILFRICVQIVVLGILHTCTALRYKPAFMAMCRTLASHADGRGLYFTVRAKVISFFHLVPRAPNVNNVSDGRGAHPCLVYIRGSSN